MIAKQSLAVALSRLKHFDVAKVALEQYPTESELAAELLWHAFMAGDLEGKRVLDLGAGTGILAIGAALLGAADVAAVEMDPAAISILRENADLYEGVERLRIVESDIRAYAERADLVVMNPPFGTKVRHADRAFLERAASLAPVIYTIHKTTTDHFVRAFAEDHGLAVPWAEERALRLKRTMAHHERERRDVAVTLYRLEKADCDEQAAQPHAKRP